MDWTGLFSSWFFGASSGVGYSFSASVCCSSSLFEDCSAANYSGRMLLISTVGSGSFAFSSSYFFFFIFSFLSFSYLSFSSFSFSFLSASSFSFFYFSFSCSAAASSLSRSTASSSSAAASLFFYDCVYYYSSACERLYAASSNFYSENAAIASSSFIIFSLFNLPGDSFLAAFLPFYVFIFFLFSDSDALSVKAITSKASLVSSSRLSWTSPSFLVCPSTFESTYRNSASLIYRRELPVPAWIYLTPFLLQPTRDIINYRATSITISILARGRR